jgi:hypothetical protein
MKFIGKVSAERSIISANECGGNGTGIAAASNRIRSNDPLWQYSAGLTCFHLMIGNQHNALQSR